MTPQPGPRSSNRVALASLILHLTIVLGGFIMMLLGSPQVVLVLFVVLKVVIDVQSHLREHAKANRSLSTPS